MFVSKNLRLEAVPPHFVYIIKFFVALQIAYSHSIPVHISDISLAENRKLPQKIWEMDLNCLSLRISRKCDSHEMIELDQKCSSSLSSLFVSLRKWRHQMICLVFNTIFMQATLPVRF